MRNDIEIMEKDFIAVKRLFRKSKSNLSEFNIFLEKYLEKYHIKSFIENSDGRRNAFEFLYTDLTKYTVALLICPPYDTTMPSLGLASVAAEVSAKSREKLVVIDLNAILYNLSDTHSFWDVMHYHEAEDENKVENLFYELIDPIRQVIENIKNSKIDILGVSIVSTNTIFTMKFLKELRVAKPGIKIIAGGPNTYQDALLLDKSLVDFRIVGDGENLFLKTIAHIRKPFLNPLPEYVHIPIANKNQDKSNRASIRKIERAFAIDLEEIAYPTFKEFNLNLYRQNTLPVYISRGCVRRCTFCYDWIVSGKKFRHLSPGKIVEYFKFLRNKYNINYFFFNDLLCNGDLEKLERMCELLSLEKLGIFWKSFAIIRSDMTLQLLEKMRKSGCDTLHYGVESGSSKVLTLMHKGYSSDIASLCLKRTFDAGIKSEINILIGYPGEEEEDFQKTKQFVIDNKKFISTVGSVTTCSIITKTILEQLVPVIGIRTVTGSTNDSAYEWSIDNNDSGIRYRRAQEMLDLLRDLGIPVGVKFTSQKYTLK